LSPPRLVHKSTSVSSLGVLDEKTTGGDKLLIPESVSAPPGIVDFEDASMDVDEEEYGEVIKRSEDEDASEPRLTELRTEGRPRGSSFASSSSSLSPILSPDSPAPLTDQDFPFSIDRPPPTDVLDEQLLTVPYSSSPKGSSDNRLRGDSISSMSTDGSANPQLSWSTTTATSSADDGSMTTPATSHLTLPGPKILSPGSIPRELPGLTSEDKEESSDSQQPTLGIRRARVPTDIDIRSISSHAQAEALVQRAQQSILDMEGVPGDDDLMGGGGRSPLSARLAAYGETLALERRLKRVEEGKNDEDSQSIEDQETPASPAFTRDGGRTNGSPRVRDMRTLETPKSTNPSRSRIRQPRRPNTGDSGSSVSYGLNQYTS
jgi:hypothetical protein